MTTAGWIACLAAVVIVAVVQAAAAQDERAFLSLVLNGVEHGEVLVLLADADVWIGVAPLRRAGLLQIGGRRQMLGDEEFVSLRSLGPGVRFTFEERSLSLHVTADPSLLASTSREVQAQRPPALQYLRSSSAFVNYAATWRGGAHLDLVSEAGVSLRGAFVSNTLALERGRRPVRGLTSLTIDERSRLRRWVVGDMFAVGGPLAGDALLGGISLAREFSIEPYVHRYPTLSLRGAVATPSTLELYVNDRLVQTEALAPGQFELRNLPLAGGLNDARMIIRDAFGNAREVSASYYLSTTALAPGVHDYRYSAGFRRRDLGAESSWAYGPPVALALHRYGFTPAVTAGGRVEVAPGLTTGGPIVAVRLPVGELEAAAAVSRHARTWGSAGALSFTHVGRRGSLGITAQSATPTYATVSTVLGGPRPRIELSAFSSVQPWPRTSVTLQHSQARLYAGGVRRRTSLLLSATVAPRLQLVASAAHGVQDGRPVRDVFGGVTVSVGGGTGTLGVENADGHVRRFGELHRPLPVGTGYGYRLRAEDGDRRLWSGLLEQHNRYGRYEVRRERLGQADHTTVTLSGGIVAIGGGVHASRPVQGSFALVRVPDVAGVRAYVNRQEAGRTNRHGDLLVPDLLAHYGNLLNIADEDVPLGFDIGDVEQTIAPPHRGGALVLFPVRRLQGVAGRVRIARGQQSTIPAYGTLTVTGPQPVSSPVGADGEFYLEPLGQGRHPAVVTHQGRTCAFDLSVPASDASVTVLGTVTCTAAEEQP